MHPPFGFALFYLRGISDTLFKNGSLPRKIESKDIYMGAIPWVLLQLILVVVVIFVPQTVTIFLEKDLVVDLNTIQLEAPPEDIPSVSDQSDKTMMEDLMKEYKKN